MFNVTSNETIYFYIQQLLVAKVINQFHDGGQKRAM